MDTQTPNPGEESRGGGCGVPGAVGVSPGHCQDLRQRGHMLDVGLSQKHGRQ